MMMIMMMTQIFLAEEVPYELLVTVLFCHGSGKIDCSDLLQDHDTLAWGTVSRENVMKLL